MRLGPIVLKLRAADTSFGNRIGGSAQLALAMDHSLTKNMAFVLQLSETADANDYDNHIQQTVTERFAVVVCVQNDTTDKDKIGFKAYDSLYDIRTELFGALLGWLIPGTEYIVSYGGGQLVGINRANLWYQFEFITSTHIGTCDGVDIEKERDELPDFDEIYAQWILTPDENIPLTGPDGLPVDTSITDMESIVDFTENPNAGAFGKGFNAEWYQTYKG